MWLFTRYGFFSIAVKQTGKVEVRARVRSHLVNLCTRFDGRIKSEHGLAGRFDVTRIITSSNNDYRYRLVISQELWALCIKELAAEQTWSNFKNEARSCSHKTGDAYVVALHDIWARMLRLQLTQVRSKKQIADMPDDSADFAEFSRWAERETTPVADLCYLCGRDKREHKIVKGEIVCPPKRTLVGA